MFMMQTFVSFISCWQLYSIVPHGGRIGPRLCVLHSLFKSKLFSDRPRGIENVRCMQIFRPTLNFAALTTVHSGRGGCWFAALRTLQLMFSSASPVDRQNGRGGHGGRREAALQSLRLPFITANSVARMWCLLTKLTQRHADSSAYLVAHVLLFETSGSCSLFYGRVVPFQAYKCIVPGRFFESQCAIVLRHCESDRHRGSQLHCVRRLIEMSAQVHACLAKNCALLVLAIAHLGLTGVT